MYQEHDHEWVPQPEVVHGIYGFRIEDKRAVFYVTCCWQPEKVHSEEFQTVYEPMGPPCEEQRRIVLAPDESLHPEVAHRVREAWVDGDLAVVDADPPTSPNDDAFVVVEIDNAVVRFETSKT